MRIEPLGDRILVKRVEPDAKTKGGLFIPETGKEKPLEGVVVSVGEGRLTDNLKLIPLRLKCGDRVLFAKYAGTDIKIEDIDYCVVREDEILCILR